MNILLLGPQGSGKGTQAKRLSAEVGVPHIATGDMLRDAMAAGTPLGLEVRPIYESGALVPDGTMIALIRERLAEPDTARGFALDGFPRTLAQSEALDGMLSAIDRPLDLVLFFDLPDDVATERMIKRAVDEQRTDDTPEAIANRLSLYHELTEPVVAHYRGTGKVVALRAERSIAEVWGQVEQALERLAAEASG